VVRLVSALNAEHAPEGPGLQGQVPLRLRAPTSRMAEQEARSAVSQAYGAIARHVGRHGFTIATEARPSKDQGFSV
jgi:hypothetical protein